MDKIQGKKADIIIVDDLTTKYSTHSDKRLMHKVFTHYIKERDPMIITKEGSEVAFSFEVGKPIMRNKFAPVAPIHIYEALANRGYVPQRILLLAHDVYKHENRDRYMALFNRGPWKDTHIIMDNSLIEVGNAITLNEIEEAVRCVEADVVVLPDSLTDGPKSAELTIAAWDEWKTRFSAPYRGDKKIELMAVIQGETEKGFMQALEMIASKIAPDWISVPRRTESKFGYNRMELIDFVRMFFPDLPIHLLGFSEYPWNDILAAQLSDVKSIDSAAPLRLPNGDVFSNAGSPRITYETVNFGHVEECQVAHDWWLEAKYEDYMLRNIQKVDKLINGDYGVA